MSQLNVDTIKNRLGTAGPTVLSLTVTNNVTVGGALTVTGSINTSGIITASSFSGNGSGLTGVAATTLTIGAGTTALPSISPTGDTNTGIFFPSADTVAISEGGTEALRVDSSGRLLVGTSTANANGGILQLTSGITFPATAVAATDVNTLDDYEEGTWTPIAGGNATDGTATYSIQIGIYTKVGRIVNITAYINYTSCTATGNIRLRGLPFTSLSSGNSGVVFGYQENLTLSANAVLGGFVQPSATFIIPQSTVTGGASSTEIAVDAAAVLMFSATYFTS